MTEVERRGGFRLNPIPVLREGLHRLVTRRVASGVRGGYVPPSGLIDDWREVGASGEPSFQNSWINGGAGNATAAFRKDGEGLVHIKGMIRSGTIGTVAFTLPTGYRPLLDHNIAALSSDTSNPARLEIRQDGAVVPTNGGTGFFSVHIAFPAEQ